MLDYMFFDDKSQGQFIHHLKLQAVEYTLQDDDLGSQVSIPDDLPEAIADTIDHLYDRLLQDQAAAIEEGEERLEKNVAGIHLTLKDGTPCTVRLDPDFISRLLTAISLKELEGLVSTIADAVEQPDNRPLCHD